MPGLKPYIHTHKCQFFTLVEKYKTREKREKVKALELSNSKGMWVLLFFCDTAPFDPLFFLFFLLVYINPMHAYVMQQPVIVWNRTMLLINFNNNGNAVDNFKKVTLQFLPTYKYNSYWN
jgi:hypothetical protein